jgi:hypothetical protein
LNDALRDRYTVERELGRGGRLLEVKRRWDPENLFRINKNIVPGTS